jgi:hypothetical protein
MGAAGFLTQTTLRPFFSEKEVKSCFPLRVNATIRQQTTEKNFIYNIFYLLRPELAFSGVRKIQVTLP